ncbi:MAG TPA: maleylpyruvate isomerase family mycothiol-dependent enzyme [Actinoplanes sp.]|jgi:uncharacterized protein (TIGR03083 family)
MEYSRFLDCLESDYTRLRAVVPIDPDATVPTCPDWTVTDLTRHVGAVYLHKTVAMREGVQPEEWPPKEIAEEEPLALLDRAYGELRHEFATRKPGDPAATWYGPDQTVGFWIRRMAQETVIHRIDGELGTGQPVAPIPDDLAVDGIDELLKIFVAYSVGEWAEDFAEVLTAPGRTYAIRTDGAAWRIRTGPGVFAVEDGDAGSADATVSGPPAAVLRWVWNREAGPSGVTVDGAVDDLKRCITIATQ